MADDGLNRSKKAQIAVILAGCGARDGSEITESVSLLIALSRKGWGVQCFAPDRKTHDVIDHLKCRTKDTDARNQLEEAARIARGQIKPLSSLNSQQFDAVMISGGFGVVKNLCNFAFAGNDATLFPDVRAALLPFVQDRKPTGALCIAPIVLALLCKEAGVRGAELTLGSGEARDAVAAIELWGAKHKATHPGQACIDAKHLMVTAPAYMFDDASPADVYASAEAMVDGIASLIEASSRVK